MTKKIFRSILTVSISVLLACFVLITGVLYDYFEGVSRSQLKDQLNTTAALVEKLGVDGLQSLAAGQYRLTWIGPDGTVIFDSSADREEMESHLDREEIREALETGYGSSARHSSTLLEKTIYEAQRLSDGSVLRSSVRQASVGVLVLGMLQPVLVISVLAIILSIWLARRMSKRIIDPLNRLDLDAPLENDAYEELSPLLLRIRSQRREIEQQIAILRQKQDEFDHITANMKEGLVLLDANGKILSINHAAMGLFGVTDSVIEADFLSVEHHHTMIRAMDAARETGHASIRVERNGRSYQLDISPVESSGEAVGLVILAFDVSERERAEQSRREFSANVSHELKTPLTAIIASTDLMENGLVKPEDVPRFIGNIKRESSRLLSLIEDIIRLSQLDEGVELPEEPVDLGAVADDAVCQLQTMADGLGVHLELKAEECVVHGIPRLFNEIIYNLTENGLKYNVPGGTVTVSVSKAGDQGILKVSDTGIGIPAEHLDRIFERFYRADKSHSKRSGGTGVGLSIVKHAVAQLNGRIEVSSEPGHGTEFTVEFPG